MNHLNAYFLLKYYYSLYACSVPYTLMFILVGSLISFLRFCVCTYLLYVSGFYGFFFSRLCCFSVSAYVRTFSVIFASLFLRTYIHKLLNNYLFIKLLAIIVCLRIETVPNLFLPNANLQENLRQHPPFSQKSTLHIG